MVGRVPHSTRPGRASPVSPRLLYRELTESDLDVFHALVTDGHIREYLMDGQFLPRAWSEQAVATSRRMFEQRGLGLWLVSKTGVSGPPIGFSGFWTFDALDPEPQLLYAFVQSATGRGFATEAAKAMIDYARAHAGFAEISSAVDEPNVGSVRVLEKLGFERRGEAPGAFGRTLLFVLPIAPGVGVIPGTH